MVGPILNILSGNGDTFVYDTFSTAKTPIIEVGCEKRNIHVRGFQQEDTTISISPKWDSILGGTGSAIPSDILNIADVLSQAFAATSVRQPWFTRGVWRGNNPLQIPVTMNFMAMTDAYTEVWRPIFDLVKLCLPKVQGKSLTSDLEDGVGKFFKMSSKEVAMLKQFIATYEVPGPALFYPINEEGTAVMYFRLGNLAELSLEACYFTEMRISWPQVYDENGYPTFATASFTVNSLDTLFIDANNNIQNIVVSGKSSADFQRSLSDSQARSNTTRATVGLSSVKAKALI